MAKPKIEAPKAEDLKYNPKYRNKKVNKNPNLFDKTNPVFKETPTVEGKAMNAEEITKIAYPYAEDVKTLY
jgi:outer membrane protein assembly factor BamA